MSNKKKLVVVLSGAGISAESGIQTFRGSDGLWEGHDVMEVASIEGYRKNPALVLDFYNQRRATAAKAVPNKGHKDVALYDEDFDVHVVTQNVDDLHEKAGSKSVLHLHGKLNEARSSVNPNLVYDLPGDKTIALGDRCERGSQLRPNIVWFGEDVPNIIPAARLIKRADALIIVGTSLQVYPAAGLVDYLDTDNPVVLVDPYAPSVASTHHTVTTILEPATTGVRAAFEHLKKHFAEREE